MEKRMIQKVCSEMEEERERKLSKKKWMQDYYEFLRKEGEKVKMDKLSQKQVEKQQFSEFLQKIGAVEGEVTKGGTLYDGFFLGRKNIAKELDLKMQKKVAPVSECLIKAANEAD